VKDCHGPVGCALWFRRSPVRRIRRRKVDQGCYLHTTALSADRCRSSVIYSVVSTGAHAEAGYLHRAVIYTLRYRPIKMGTWLPSWILLGRGRALPVYTTGDLSADTRMAAIAFNELLEGGAPSSCQSPPLAPAFVPLRGLGGRRNVIMEISPKVPVPLNPVKCNFEALRANTTSYRFFPSKISGIGISTGRHLASLK
jgi:hypothetical protein